jgi:antitoxin YefM
MRVVNFSDARNNLKKVIDDVVDDSDFTVISRRDAPDAVLLSLDSFNSLMETVHLLKSPANAVHLARSLAQMESGKSVERELVEDDGQSRRVPAALPVSAWPAAAAKPAARPAAAKPAAASRPAAKPASKAATARPAPAKPATPAMPASPARANEKKEPSDKAARR